MNRDDIIRMARQVRDGGHWNQLDLINFANLVAAAERQRQQLTDEQISVLWHQSGEQPFKFARMLLK